METARSSLRLRSAHRGDVDQRSDRLRFSAAGHCAVSMPRFEGATAWAAVTPCERDARRERLARLVANAGLARDFSSVGSGRDSISAGILRGSCDARIRRPLWRNNSSAAAASFLFTASIAQIRAVERADDWDRGCRTPIAKLAVALRVSRNVSGNFLAALLEHWWTDRDVAHPIEARRQNFPCDSAALFAAGGANWR